MSKKRIWFNADLDFLGATGVNSLREMAELALADGNEYVLETVMVFDDERPTVEAVEKHLEWLGVKAERVPTAILHNEYWEMTFVYPCAFDDKPGRGYVKVLGVSF